MSEDFFGLNILDNPALGIWWADEDEQAATDKEDTEVTATQSTAVAGTEEAAMGNTVNLRMGTCNVKNTPDMPRPTVVKCGKIVSDDFDLLGFQELGEKGEDRRDVLTGLGDKWRMSVATPVDVQTQIGWVEEKGNLIHANWHMCVPGNQPYPNPPRGFTEGIFNPKRGFPFRFVDTHFVNKAWNTVPDSHKALRRRNWEIHYQILAEFMRKSARTLPTVLVGDFNRTVVKSFGPNFKWLATADSEHSTGIDKVGIMLPKGYGVTTQGHINIPTPSDHNAVGVRIKIVRKK
jgi:endonuclease/exonuclease/phosphatase family metal-dependent hydrolase